MKSDNISRIAKSDHLILELAKREYLKQGHNKEQHNYIRTKLREIAKLLYFLRKNTNNSTACLDFYINPKYFKDIIKAVHEVAKYRQYHAYICNSIFSVKARTHCEEMRPNC
ncbi:hypothetical protein SNE40_023743 [Patella caerulea]|uniref:Uncharacterized protein n=1 Tax=Patella caerulea TaxID=87958 RepID=A0AAN8G2X1_PATCE